MHVTISSLTTVRRFLQTGFTSRDIAEALISFDEDRSGDAVREQMITKDFDVVGVRRNGFVVGYVHQDDLDEGNCSEKLRYFGTDEIVDADTPLRRLVLMLDERERVFVRLLGPVGGIVTRADLQKPPVRMWLFGLVTIIEHAFGEMIKSDYPDDAWRDQLSQGRLELAERFQAERKRRNQSLDLLSCLQFADKAHIVLKDPETRDRLGIPSRSAAKEAIRNVEQLRNLLAHSHDLSECWEIIVRLSSRFDDLLDRLYVI
ncbi:MAG: hypothetical protein ACYTGC_15055 [Planctomycetota bacterium]